MNLVEGLSAANLALGLLKDLRDIDRSVDEAAFKLKIAEITSALADAKISLSDANLQINDKDLELAKLKEELEQATSGEVCPKCREGRMQLLTTKRHSFGMLGGYGVEDWQYTCDNLECEFEQTRMHDPHGAIPKSVTRR